jgi:hypothetical protein
MEPEPDGWVLPALLAALGYIPWRTSSHRGLRWAERTTWIYADDAAGRLGSAAERRPRSAGRRCPGEDRGLRSGQTGGEPGGRGSMLHTTEVPAAAPERDSSKLTNQHCDINELK